MNPPPEGIPGDFLPPQAGAAPAAAAFDFKAFLDMLRRHYWIVLLGLLAGLLGGLAFNHFSTPVYRAQAEIKAQRRAATSGVSISGDQLSRETTLLPEDLKTVERTFLTTTLVQRVISKLNLTAREGFISPNRRTATEGELTGFLLGSAGVSLITDTRLISVWFDHRNPDTAREVANALAEEGVALDRERLAAAVQANVEYLKAEAEKINSKLTQSRKELNAYTRSQGSISVDAEMNIVAEKLRDLNIRATEARAERVKVEAAYQEVQRCNGDPEKLANLEIIRAAPGVAALANRINDIKGNLAKLERRYRAQHPFVVQADTELKDLEKSFHERVREAANGVAAALAAARHSEETLLKETEEQEQKVINTRDLAIHSQMLRGQIEVDQLSYEATLKRLNEELSQTRSEPVLLQLSALATGAYPTTVPPQRALTSALFGGLLLGLGIIGLMVQLDSTLKTPEAAERALGLPVLTVTPETTGYDPAAPRWNECALLRDPHSPAAEAFRTLRTSLHMMMEAGQGRFILITAAAGGDGITFSTLNLGVALAQSGLRTLLIDANLRTPALEERVFGSRGHYGLADFLQGRAPLSSIILASGVANLDIVTAGSPSQHPVELLSRSRLRVLLDGVQPLYDRVIVDSSAVDSVSDTLCFARYLQQICLVIRAGQTTKAAARRTIDLLARSGARVSGVILNRAARQQVRPGPPPTAAALATGEEESDFPKTCTTCGRHYETLEEYLATTTPPEEEAPPLPYRGNAEYQQSQQYLRRCACGTLLSLPPVMRRDLSHEGQRRRQLFSELLDALQQAGLPREEARTQLLLTLKTWRNEIGGALPGEESEAGLRRRQLFEELLAGLRKAGFAEESARTKLLEIIEAWRGAP